MTTREQCIRHLVIEGIASKLTVKDNAGKAYYYVFAGKIWRVEEIEGFLFDAHIVPWLGY